MARLPYINARVHGLRSAMLDRELLREMAEVSDVGLAVGLLLDTVYGSALSEAAAAGATPLAAVDAAVDAVAGETIERLARTFADPRRCSLRLLLGDWDVQALKTVLRGLHNGHPPATTLAAVAPAPGLRRSALEELAEAGSVDHAVGLLLSWSVPWARVLDRQMSAYRATGSLTPLELALDRERFRLGDALAGLGRRDRRLMRRVLEMEAEVRNVIACLAARQFGHEPELLAVDGRVSGLAQDLAVAATTDDMIERLAECRYRTAVEKALAFMVDTRGLPVLERMLDEEILCMTARLALRYPLSIAVVDHYCRALRNEMMNIRLIAQAQAGNLPRNTLQAGLLLPTWWN